MPELLNNPIDYNDKLCIMIFEDGSYLPGIYDLFDKKFVTIDSTLHSSKWNENFDSIPWQKLTKNIVNVIPLNEELDDLVNMRLTFKKFWDKKRRKENGYY